MKLLSKEEIVNGLHLIKVTIGFNVLNGFTQQHIHEKVEVRKGITPDPRCDMVISGSSVSFRKIFELGDVYEYLCENDAFTLKSWGTANVYCYCLPENFHSVKDILEASLIASVERFLKKLKTDVASYEKVLLKLKPKEEGGNVAT